MRPTSNVSTTRLPPVRLSRSLDNLAREHTEEAVGRLVQIMRTGEDRDSIKAVDSLLDRGHGKPLSATIALPASRQQAAMLAAFSDAELIEQIQGTALPRLLQDPIIEVDALPDPLLR